MAGSASRVSARLKALLADTLFKRLFALMWLALVISHAVAFLVVTRNGLDAGGRCRRFRRCRRSRSRNARDRPAHRARAPPASGARMPCRRARPRRAAATARGPATRRPRHGPRPAPPPFPDQGGMGAATDHAGDGPMRPGAAARRRARRRPAGLRGAAGLRHPPADHRPGRVARRALAVGADAAAAGGVAHAGRSRWRATRRRRRSTSAPARWRCARRRTCSTRCRASSATRCTRARCWWRRSRTTCARR